VIGTRRIRVAAFLSAVSLCTPFLAQSAEQSWPAELWTDMLIPREEFVERCGNALSDLTYGPRSTVAAIVADRDFLTFELRKQALSFDANPEERFACCETALLAVADRHQGAVQEVFSGLVHLHCAEIHDPRFHREPVTAHDLAARKHFLRAVDDPDPKVKALVAYYLSTLLEEAEPGSDRLEFGPELNATLRWLAEEVERGNSYALIGMVSAYEKGLGIAKDPDRAQELFKAFRPIQRADEQ